MISAAIAGGTLPFLAGEGLEGTAQVSVWVAGRLTRMVDVQCRLAGDEDFAFLATMLGEAAVWRPSKSTPTGDQVLADPRYGMYLAGWPGRGDYGLVAEQNGPVGAAWYRTYTEAIHGYGFVAEDIPEMSIAVIGLFAMRRGVASV